MDSKKTKNTELFGFGNLKKTVAENLDGTNKMKELADKNFDNIEDLSSKLTSMIKPLKDSGQFKEIPNIMNKIKDLKKQKKHLENIKTKARQINITVKDITKMVDQYLGHIDKE